MFLIIRVNKGHAKRAYILLKCPVKLFLVSTNMNSMGLNQYELRICDHENRCGMKITLNRVPVSLNRAKKHE